MQSKIYLEIFFLLFFWGWVFCVILFLRTTRLPRIPLTDSPAAWSLPFESVCFQATDGVRLSGWKISADPQEPWIILCHGLGTNRSDMLDLASSLFRARYNVLLFDFRAHGDSEGRATSFGWLEQRDLEGALAFLGKQPEIPERPYGVLGISMGGAVAVMVAAKDERLGAIVLDSSYEDLEASIARHLEWFYRLPRVPFLLCASSAYRLRFGIWPRHMSPLKSIGRIRPRSVLVIHGANDQRIPIEQANALFEAAGHPKEFWIVPDASHLDAYQMNREEYQQRLIRFFDTHLRTS